MTSEANERRKPEATSAEILELEALCLARYEEVEDLKAQRDALLGTLTRLHDASYAVYKASAGWRLRNCEAKVEAWETELSNAEEVIEIAALTATAPDLPGTDLPEGEK